MVSEYEPIILWYFGGFLKYKIDFPQNLKFSKNGEKGIANINACFNNSGEGVRFLGSLGFG